MKFRLEFTKKGLLLETYSLKKCSTISTVTTVIKKNQIKNVMNNLAIVYYILHLPLDSSLKMTTILNIGYKKV